MGRGKIEIKRIENSSNRQVTYSKRKSGILKKAKEITVLCDAQVSLIIFAASGKMHEYISPSTTLIDILERYHKTSGKRLWDAKHEDLNNEIDRLKKENDNMQIELRHLKGEDVNTLNYKELMALEDALECGLAGIRERQMEIYRACRRNGKILEEENRELNFILQRLAMEGARELENGFDQSVREFHSQLPFAFRVQPMQPNLHERM
ncbi:floral homeotic protein GLOBOSA-like isoform X2 [Neltuma alba]|uniref:floral homeotic protein GLOBOSA-like isoform X2 n=1 Tax=Neltuma alba TaxID=207710 RepID=UPI0010A2D6F6|nr:floral homeotic protein GLOBOSA-like isoform X2 [Prosopis alba]